MFGKIYNNNMWIPKEGDTVNYTLTGATVYTVNRVDRRLDSNLNETFFCDILKISESKSAELIKNVNFNSLKYVPSQEPVI